MNFLNPFLLLGALGGAVPLLIHLLARKKAKKVEFSSVEFLEEAAKKEIKRLKLRQILLLILRVLAIILFAIGLARPSLNVPGKGGGQEGSAIAIVFDNSLSMSYEGDDGSYIEAAKEKALELTKVLTRKDEAFLVFAATPPSARFDTPVRDPEKIRKEIEGIQPTERGTDIPAAVEMASQLLAKSEVSSKEIYIFSDMQKTGFEKQGRLRLDKGVRVFLVQPGDGKRENIAIEKIDAAGRGFSSDEVVRVTVRNDSEKPARTDVRIFGGDQSIGEGSASLTPDSRQEISIPARFNKDFPWGRAELPRDRLRADDIRYFLPPVKPLKVLIVRDSARKIDFLSIALNPWGEGGGGIQPVVKTPYELSSLDLSEFGATILDGVSRFDERALDKLTSFVFSGGGVLITAGDDIDGEFYSSKLLPRILPSRITGVEETGTEGGFMRLRPTVASHPIFRSFGISPGEALPEAKFSRILKVEPLPGSRVIAEFRPGVPAIVERERVLFLATSLDGKWNDLVMNASFAPLLHEMVYFLSRGGTDKELLVGNQIEVEKPSVPGAQVFECVNTAGERVKLAETAKLGKIYLVSEPVEKSGIYWIEAAGQKLAMFQVNVDPAESNLDSCSRDELRKLFPENQVVFAGKRDKLKDRILTARSGKELALYFFVVVLFLLSVELWLSRPGRVVEK